ncbi:MAG: acetyl-CoA carboxylase biotin carboxyl carrier protein [Coriobacteriia bacterium]|nr:acetyl-CoA carboxylase biotin carboxyl carrier protein [Coriobacteriia bacterium]
MDTALPLILPTGSDSVEAHIERLAAVLDAHALTRVEYEQGSLHVVLEKQAEPVLLPAPFEVHTAPVPSGTSGITVPFPVAAQQAQAASQPSGNTTGAPDEVAKQLVKSPLVGVAYRCKEPGAAPFVSVGDRVNEDTVLCLIEAMKMFNEIKAPCSGTVTAIHFEDAVLVEHGALLFSLD